MNNTIAMVVGGSIAMIVLAVLDHKREQKDREAMKKALDIPIDFDFSTAVKQALASKEE
jgi:hypothetical protein